MLWPLEFKKKSNVNHAGALSKGRVFKKTTVKFPYRMYVAGTFKPSRQACKNDNDNTETSTGLSN